MASIEETYQEKNIRLQNSFNRRITLLMNANVRKLAVEISKTSNKNTNNNKQLSKTFTKLKREMRNDLTELIKSGVFDAEDIADNKNNKFLKDVEESV
jgi:hypothetical protein